MQALSALCRAGPLPRGFGWRQLLQRFCCSSGCRHSTISALKEMETGHSLCPRGDGELWEAPWGPGKAGGSTSAPRVTPELALAKLFNKSTGDLNSCRAAPVGLRVLESPGPAFPSAALGLICLTRFHHLTFCPFLAQSFQPFNLS